MIKMWDGENFSGAITALFNFSAPSSGGTDYVEVTGHISNPALKKFTFGVSVKSRFQTPLSTGQLISNSGDQRERLGGC
jgi:hypothetical protein